MKKTIQHIFLLLAIAVCWSCVEDELITFQKEDSIYFPLSTEGTSNNPNTDSLFYSVGLVPKTFTDSTVSIPVKVLGTLMNEDRSFTVELAQGTTAKEGVDFEFINDHMIPAGEVSSTIDIRLIKTEEIANDTVVVKLKLLPNDHFNTEMTTYTDVYGKAVLSHVDLDIYLTGVIQEPRYWFEPYLGKFSAKKFFLMVEVLEFDPLIYMGNVSLSQSQYFGLAMKRYLDQQKALGNTIYDEDGTEMEMGVYI
ncbi:DUF4843 domain-containing protein [Algoriphagus halophytocola]|uniref:DUF4843 domain-containing protein n=1 Tax=Algoriphagus halophytocola TaxID=2991499 RepID=A0ABY6MCU6_9BACT|nr:DUF4843 domain-containing protein [Algoriphagus sp. TR-M5]UZD21139.1 DUF4843 domain-containing protein [Algoriphagus sp. TR-M5]